MSSKCNMKLFNCRWHRCGWDNVCLSPLWMCVYHDQYCFALIRSSMVRVDPYPWLLSPLPRLNRDLRWQLLCLYTYYAALPYFVLKVRIKTWPPHVSPSKALNMTNTGIRLMMWWDYHSRSPLHTSILHTQLVFFSLIWAYLSLIIRPPL